MKQLALSPLKNGVTGVTRVTQTFKPLFLLDIFCVTRTEKLLSTTCYMEKSCYRTDTSATLLASAFSSANRCVSPLASGRRGDLNVLALIEN